MAAVMDIDEKAKKLGIKYEEEAAKENVLERYFVEIMKLVNTINTFNQSFGSMRKLVKTLDEKYEEMIEDDRAADKFK